MLALRAVARHGFIRAARKSTRATLGPCPFTPANRPSAAEAFCAIAPSMRPAPTRARRYETHNGSSTGQDSLGVHGVPRPLLAERHRATSARREAAWKRERMQRQCKAKRRREARLFLRAVARLAARSTMYRRLAYRSIEAIIDRRRAREYDIAQSALGDYKVCCGSERRISSGGRKPMNYRSFVTERAHARDLFERQAEYWTDWRLRWIAGTSGRRKH